MVLLGRTASAADVNGWTSSLPTLGRTGVAMSFLQSLEFRGNVIRTLYSGNTTLPPTSFIGLVPDLLHLSAQPATAEVAGWANTKLDILSLEVAFASSDEYFASR